MNEMEIIFVEGCRRLIQRVNLKVKFSEKLNDHYTFLSSFLKGAALGNVEDKINFCLIGGFFKTTPQQKPAKSHSTGCVSEE